MAWLDELAAFRYPAALDNLLFGLRLGEDPRLCVTTTPRPVRLVTDLIGDPTTAIARGTTYDNRANLAPSFFERIVTKYEGTRLGQQELLAEVLEVARRHLVPRVRPGEARDASRPSTTRGSRCTWRSTAGSRGTCGARSGSRSDAGLDPARKQPGHGLRRLPRRGPVLGGGGPGDPGARARSCPAGGGWTRSGSTRRRRPGRGSARRRTASSSGSSARGCWADGRRTASPTASTSSRSCWTTGCLLHPSAVREAEGGVPELRPAADRPAATGWTSRPTRSTRTRT